MSLENIFPNKEQFDTMNTLLAAIASSQGGIKIQSFKDVQQIVRMGLASKIFSIGDQLICEKETALTANVGNSEGSPGISAATVSASTFHEAVGGIHSGDYEFIYNGVEWHYNGESVSLSTYGISVTGTPIAGDEVVVHETTSQLVWDIIGFDHDVPANAAHTHSMTLLLHDCLLSLQFDATEALYYCAAELPAGTYHFTLLSGYDTAYGGGKTYQFTLTQAVPAGGQLMFPWGYNTQASSVKISSYSSRTSTTAIESVSVSEGTDGTDLGTANGSTTHMNYTHRIRYGSNNWKESAIRQYLNSAASAGSVWSPKTEFDRPPSWASSTAGFMKDLDTEFLSVVGTVTKRTARNTVTDGGGYDDTEDKFFLLSRSEVFAGKENSIDEGDPYPYYSLGSDYSSPNGGADSNRIKYRSGSAQYWWLRTPDSGSGYIVRGLGPTGSLYSGSAYDSSGVAPACNII